MDYIKPMYKIAIFALILFGLVFAFDTHAQTLYAPPWRETFETYNANYLHLQGPWYIPPAYANLATSTYTVISTPLSNIYGGVRGLVMENVAGTTGPIYATSTYDLVLNSIVYGSARIKHEGAGTLGNALEILTVSTNEQEGICWFKLIDGGNLYAKNDGAEILIGTLATSTWALAEMEYNFATENCRARINNGTWSSNLPFWGTYNGSANMIRFHESDELTGSKKVYVDNIVFSNTESGQTQPTIEFEFPLDNATTTNDFSAFRVKTNSGDTIYATSTYLIDVMYWKDNNSTPIYSEQQYQRIGTSIPFTEKTWIVNKTHGSQGAWTSTAGLYNASGTLIDSETINWYVISSSTVSNTGVSASGIITDDYIAELFPDMTINQDLSSGGICALAWDCSFFSSTTDFASGVGCAVGYGLRVGIAFAFCPNEFSTNLISKSMEDFSHTPPFNAVFETVDNVYGVINETSTTTLNALTATTSIFITPINSTPITFAMNTDLEDIVGTTTRDAIYNLLTALIWLATAYKAVRMLTLT